MPTEIPEDGLTRCFWPGEHKEEGGIPVDDIEGCAFREKTEALRKQFSRPR